MNRKGFAHIVLIVSIVILVGVIGHFMLKKPKTIITAEPSPLTKNDQKIGLEKLANANFLYKTKENQFSGGASLEYQSASNNVLVYISLFEWKTGTYGEGKKVEGPFAVYIHEGTCQSIGKKLFDLNEVKTGASRTELNALPDDFTHFILRPLVIDIHTNEGVVICGKIEKPMPQPEVVQ
jgi:hypothetical protein